VVAGFRSGNKDYEALDFCHSGIASVAHFDYVSFVFFPDFYWCFRAETVGAET
jgi:hypothetical protein